MRTSTTMLWVGGLLAIAGTAVAQGGAGGEAGAGRAPVVQSMGEARWGIAPLQFPLGAEMAVLEGDPRRPGPFTVRLRLPSQYAIAAHAHPADERMVVLSGSLTVGAGDKLVKGLRSNTTLGVGGFVLMPAGTPHFVYTGDEETVVLLYGRGPMRTTYVELADDPRSNGRTLRP